MAKLTRIRANRTKPAGLPINTAPVQQRVTQIPRRGRVLIIGNYFQKAKVISP